MVQEVKEYVCDICNQKYHNEYEAVNCEIRGQPKIILPRGLIFKSLAHGSNPGYTIYAVKADNIVGHMHNLQCWYLYNDPSWKYRLENINTITLPFDRIELTKPRMIEDSLTEPMTVYLFKYKKFNASEWLKMTTDFWKDKETITIG